MATITENLRLLLKLGKNTARDSTTLPGRMRGIAVATTLTAIAGYAGYQMYNNLKYHRQAALLLQDLDAECDDVVDEMLIIDEAEIINDLPANHPATNSADPLLGNELAIVQQSDPPMQFATALEEAPGQNVNPTGELDLNYSRPRNRNKYVKVLLQMVKGRFGVPVDNEANRLVIRRFLHDYMTKRRNRPSVICGTIPVVLEMSFLPDCREVELRSIASHPIILERKAYGSTGWWSWFYSRVTTLRAPAP